ncbi:DUF7882 family protein [Pseudolysinimonas sp.]|uniref:DUF7882 family protein n=1 Tax=Pseudolysinimonas sp. TaxID=2680009 RepID=UPI003F7FD288
MGTLFYGSGRLPVLIDDVVLAHIQALVSSKLRRHEGFLLSWSDSMNIGNGRSSVWVHPAADLHFKFDGGKSPAIDQALFAEMANAANGPRGLVLEGLTLAQDPRRPLRKAGRAGGDAPA